MTSKIGVLATDIEIQILANQAAIMTALRVQITAPGYREHGVTRELTTLLDRRVEETRAIADEQAKIRGLSS